MGNVCISKLPLARLDEMGDEMSIAQLKKKLIVNEVLLKSDSKLYEAALSYEAKSFYKTKVDKHKVRIEELESEILKLRTKKFEAKVKLKTELSYLDWWTMVQKMYYINSNFTVTSRTKNWKEGKSWTHSSELDAKERILKLVGYKAYDRSRGLGSEALDAKKVLEIESST